jgi:hypothetical protein
MGKRIMGGCQPWYKVHQNLFQPILGVVAYAPVIPSYRGE